MLAITQRFGIQCDLIKVLVYRKPQLAKSLRQGLLESGQKPVDEISVEVSYEDPSFFRRLFKRRTGLTPSQYRRMFQPVIKASEKELIRIEN